MNYDLEKLTRPKSKAIPCIIRRGDVINCKGDAALQILDLETDGRIALSILGDFNIQRKPRRK